MRKPIDYFDDESLKNDLSGKALRGGVVVAIAQALQMVATMGVLAILSRLLTREDFGLMAMVAVLTGFANMFVDAGLSIATIQRKKITRHQVTNLFWIACGFGLVVACTVAMLSPIVAWFFKEPRLTLITLAISTTFAISGLSIQHQALLRRAMLFNQISAIQLSSSLAGQVATILLAWQTRSYWALVAMPIVTVTVRTILLWYACSWRPGRWQHGVGSREMVIFGGNLTGFSFANYFARNADKLLIGWMWGAGSLGIYDRAYKLMLGPLTQVMGPLNAVVHPTMCRLQDDAPRYRKTFQHILESLLSLTTPISVLCIVAADWIVIIMLGEGWEDVTPILTCLAVSGLFQPAYSSVGWLYISQNRSKDLIRWGIPNSSVIVLSFLAGLRWGAFGVAVSYTACFCLLILPITFWAAGRRGPVCALDIWSTMFRPLALSLITVVPVITLRFAYPDLTPSAGMAWSALLVLVTYGITLFIFRHRLTALSHIFGVRAKMP